MIAAVDVHYFEVGATAAGVLFSHWTSDRTELELREFIERVEPYEPGSFYRRELPCLLKLLKPVQNRVATVIVDGYVWLGPGNRPGLGAHLYKALDEKIPVIGVAKSIYSGATDARHVLRGRSRRPLYVTAVGMDSLVAAEHIRTMHGAHRIPTLLKRVDELCRSPERPSTEGEQQMSAQNQSGKNSLNPKTLALLHRYLDDFVVVGKARKGELSSVELGALLREAVVDAEEIRQIVSEYKRFREG